MKYMRQKSQLPTYPQGIILLLVFRGMACFSLGFGTAPPNCVFPWGDVLMVAWDSPPRKSSPFVNLNSKSGAIYLKGDGNLRDVCDKWNTFKGICKPPVIAGNPPGMYLGFKEFEGMSSLWVYRKIYKHHSGVDLVI